MPTVKNITTQSDHDELSKAYKFVIEDNHSGSDRPKRDARWQDRMVRKYHQHLYKTHVIADLSRYDTSRIGLRWRTKSEVTSGKGIETCGNKHCPCYFKKRKEKRAVDEVKQWKANPQHCQILNEYFHSSAKDENCTNESELKRLLRVPHGLGLYNYEVHFEYEEHGEKKEELVNLKLCLRCAPKLFHGKGSTIGARDARGTKKNNLSQVINASAGSPGKNEEANEK